jgi:hypothetical protein
MESMVPKSVEDGSGCTQKQISHNQENCASPQSATAEKQPGDRRQNKTEGTTQH